MIAIFDYGAGNLRSVQNTLGELGCEYTLIRDSAGLLAATKILLPGVGHFGQMMRALDAMQVRAALVECLRGGVPFLGICLGLQALFTASDEAPEVEGLGIFQGRVRRFPRDARVPHMGWNELEVRAPTRLLARLDAKPYVYFAHSYYVPETEAAAAVCNYCVPYTAVLDSANIFGVQFHPEKSGPVGLRIVKNFVEL
jgi:imidazole glycerol phosphate synthase glutamine amidotransferase subunit